jgi:hypothetical protein
MGAKDMGKGNLRRVRLDRRARLTVRAGGSAWTPAEGVTTFKAGQQVHCMFAGTKLILEVETAPGRVYRELWDEA